jgi:hypothetical protein
MKKTRYYLKYSITYYILETLRWLAILSPFAYIFYNNKEKYFVNVEGASNGTKMTIGMVILIGILVWVILREINKKKGRSHAPSVISGIIWWGVAFALSYCFKIIINDLTLIIGAGLVGQCIGFVFEMLAQSTHEKRKLYQQAEINAKVNVETRVKNKEILPYE